MHSNSNEEEDRYAEIRKKKMEEYRRMLQEKEMEAKLDAVVRQMVEDTAYDRISNVKVAKGLEFYKFLVQHIAAYYQKYGVRLSDATVRNILENLVKQTRREYNIKFMRK